MCFVSAEADLVSASRLHLHFKTPERMCVCVCSSSGFTATLVAKVHSRRPPHPPFPNDSPYKMDQARAS